MKLLQKNTNTTFTLQFRLLLIALFLFAFSMPSFGQEIWRNDINGTQPSTASPFTAGQVVAPNMTVSGIKLGPGILTNAGNNRYNARNWSTGAFDNTDYFEFILTPATGYRIDLASFVYSAQKSSQGPASYALRSSQDGFTANIGTPGVGNNLTISLSSLAGVTNPASVTFRFYAWGATAATGTFSINDFIFNGNVSATCASVAITSVYPTSGPVGTEVTISAASGLAGATATFGGVAATVVSSSATQLVVKIPAGAATGNLIVSNSVACASLPVAYTVIKEDITSCEINSTFNDIIISEVYDEFSGQGGAVELFNPTASAILLSTNDYRLRRFADSGPAFNEVDLVGTIPAGGTYLISAITAPAPLCTGVTYPETLNSGYNGLDKFELRKFGTTVIDVVIAPNEVGYNVYRNTNAVGPTATYSPADWTVNSNEDCSDLGYFPPVTKLPPTLVTSPVVPTLSCTTTGITISASGTEGHTAGLPLAYKWYVVAPGAPGTWSPITDGGIYSGADTATLNISSITGVNNYQYYCQIRENSTTCYTASNAVIIKDLYTTIWTSTGWSNGLPSLTKRAIIDFTYDTGTDGSFETCSLMVKSTRALTISPSTYVTVENEVTVAGTLDVEDDGSLVQNNNTSVNTGDITVKREVSIKKYDYVYWSSPVVNFPVASVSTGTPSNYIYRWLPTQGGTAFGIWQNAVGNMVQGKGYIIRSPSVWPATAQIFPTSFSGNPHNGIITAAIARGGQQGIDYDNGNGVMVTKNDDNWNLVGNPYPSAINAAAFLSANGNIEGAVRLWTHGTLPVSATDPFYGNFLYNYNSNDYIVWNGTATTSGPAGFTGDIASGQGFFVLMNDGAEDYTQTVVFNNQMRSSSFGNSQFYRQGGASAENANDGETDKSRIWLDLVGTNGAVNRTVVGYVAGATLDKDRMYDAYARADSDQNFYSLINDELMTIQGRPVPFDQNDKVPLGLKITASGNYKIAISAADGLFQDTAANIYIEDKLLGIIHDLRQAPYDFSSEAGTVNNRFVLRYNNTVLGNTAFDLSENNVVVAAKDHRITVKSYTDPIESITVYDLPGRQIFNKQNVNGKEFTIAETMLQQQTLIVKTKLQNGQIVTRKIVF
ncbi:MAG TPA: T9SS sorting signal type C domain-containing protein [Flavobacterium sp.]|nr:T9SS sorting signal type C domain-containing protein [Flavobacterium sp.]